MEFLALLSVLYSAFMIVVPIVVITMLVGIRTELRALGESQRRTAEALEETNQKLSSLGMGANGLLGGNLPQLESPTWNVLAQNGPTTASGALAELLADPEIAKGAAEVRRIYGAGVCVSFLTRKAGERGLAIDPPLTVADLPTEF